MTFRNTVWVVSLVLVAGCIGKVRPYPSQDPLWTDTADTTPFSPMPEEYFSPFAWDGADNMIFRPFARVFAVDPAGQAPNVNAMDEVPDSSWFTNRLGRKRYTVDEVINGPCGDEPPLDPTGPWTITSAKPNGANPGFIIEDQTGRPFLIKFDSPSQPERAVAADAIGTILYWAAGFYTPCNQVVFFDEDILQISDTATTKVLGKKVPLTKESLAPVFEKAYHRKDGKWRAASSRFLPGKPLGPWRYEGTREDDPNDVIPHEDRRELRGAYILAALINHFDSREQNTLAMWIEDEQTGKGYVRHNYIDFGDSFGSQWAIPKGIGRQFGHSAYLDMPHLMQDFVTLGAIPRVWRKNKKGPAGDALGYFNAWSFKADKYRPGYPNPAFLRATEHDRAWMARILADFTPEMLKATVKQGRFEREITESELTRILLGRREKLLKRYLTRLSPLTQPRVRSAGSGAVLCMRDLAVFSGVVKRDERRYWQRAWRLKRSRRLANMDTGALRLRGEDEVCVSLPSIEGATADAPGYLILDVNALNGIDDKQARPIRVHLYQRGPGRYQVVGVQRPSNLKEPRRHD